MRALASAGQLRMGLWRLILVVVPIMVLLGISAATLSNSSYGNLWFAALRKPAFTPPGWAFATAWTILYALMGLAVAMVLHARGSPGRLAAVVTFVVALALNLAWSPLFFGAHRIHAALWLIGAMFVATLATTILFARIRPVAALLMLPYLGWLLFAATLNGEIDRMNPQGETLVPRQPSTQISI